MAGSTTLAIWDDRVDTLRGLASDDQRLQTPRGVFRVAENIRYIGGEIRSRLGSSELVAAPSVSGGVFAGGTLVPFGAGGQSLALCAIQAGTATRIFGNVYSGSTWGGWVEATAASGKYGSTRLSNNAEFCTFCAVPGENGIGGVVVQNGIDAPRYVSIGGFGTGEARQIEPIKAPEAALAFAPVFSGGAKVDVTGSGTASNSSGSLSWSSWELTVSSSPAVGDWAQIQATSSVDFGQAGQVWLAIEDVNYPTNPFDGSWARCLRVELVKASGDRLLVHDPAGAFDSAVVVDTASPRVQIWAFPCGDHIGNMNDIRGIRVTVVDNKLTPNLSLRVRMMCAGGQVPGTASYLVAWNNSSTKVDSPGVVLRAGRPVAPSRSAVAPTLQKGPAGHGMSAGLSLTTLPGSFVLPQDERLLYRVTVPVFAPGSDDGGKGVDFMRVFRKDPGDDDFFYCGEIQTSEWNGSSWVARSPFTAFGSRATWVDETAPTSKDLALPGPDAYVEPIPRGQGLCLSGGRLYVGTKPSAGARSNSVMASDEGFWWRFRRLVKMFQNVPDLASGFEARLDGDDEALAILPAGVASLSGSAVDVLAKKGTYRISGLGAEKQTNVGIACPSAFALAETSEIFWVDDRLNVRQGAGIAENLSEDLVEGILGATTAANVKRVAGWESENRLYFAIGDRRLLVMLRKGGRRFESLDILASGFDVAQFVPWPYPGDRRLVYFTSTGRLCTFGIGTQDGTTNIRARLAGRIALESFPALFTIKDMGILIGQAASGSFQFDLSFPSRGATTSQASTDLRANAWTWRWSTPTGTQPQTNVVEWALSLTAPGGTAIKGIAAQVLGTASKGPDRV